MKQYLNILMLILAFKLMGQPPANRYISPLFQNVSETTNVLFSSNVPKPVPGGGFYEWLTGLPLNAREYQFTNVDLRMNIFQPSGDTLSKRPLVIICFGGGFLNGSKDHWSIRLIAQELAKRGFVTAVIDYRLGMNVFNEELSKRAVYRGIQDGRSAVRFFKADAAGANIYKVDPDQIYLGGHSAGAFIATHNAYMDKESERPPSTMAWPQGSNTCPDQLCLDCVGNNTSYSGHAKAVFSLAGALGFTSYMETANDPKIVMFHSQDDDTVPYNSGEPFGSVSGFIVGFDLPTVYGSLPMSQQADVINLPDQFNSYTNRGHSVHEQSSTALYTDIIPGISNWFNDQLLKPVAHPIDGKAYVCASFPTVQYSTIQGQAAYYQWEVIGGTILTSNPNNHTISVLWNIAAPSHEIKLTPFSMWDSKGATTTKSISISPTFNNVWQSNNGSWIETNNWSLVQLPESCHHVIFTDKTVPTLVTVPNTVVSEIQSLSVGTQVTLHINPQASITITD
jgi:hypothetical protein